MIEKSVLEKLYYQDQLSMMDIAKRLKVGPHKVSWWMKKHGLNRRSWSEATYVKQNPNGDPFSIKPPSSPEDHFLLGLALGLYWGEGTKSSLQAVRLGNTDPTLINAFVRFLTEICQVEQRKIKFGLQIFADINKDEALKYWQREIGFPPENFYPKVTVSPPQGKGTYRKKIKVWSINCNSQ